MKYYSEFTEKYVNDICEELNAKGVIASKFFNISYKPENFETLTIFLQRYVVQPLDIFTHLNSLGLVNRGRCPYTGQKIDESFPSWSFMKNRRVYVSHEGYAIMQKEDEEEFERTMGYPKPKKSASNGKGGCYIATACYGNEFAPEVLRLKQFRDNTLTKNYFGILFIKAYYLLSPLVAEKLKHNEKLNSFVKIQILDRLIKKLNNGLV